MYEVQSCCTTFGVLTTATDRVDRLLAEACYILAADYYELKDMQREMEQLDWRYHSHLDKCFKRIQWIMYLDMRSSMYKKARLLKAGEGWGEFIRFMMLLYHVDMILK